MILQNRTKKINNIVLMLLDLVVFLQGNKILLHSVFHIMLMLFSYVVLKEYLVCNEHITVKS